MRPIALFLLALAPASLSAQKPTAEQSRYDTAAEWVELVMAEGDYDVAASQVMPAVAAQLGASQLETAAGQLGGQLGALQSLEPREQSMRQGFHMVVFDSVFDAGTFDVQVFLSDNEEVAGFFIRPPSQEMPWRRSPRSSIQSK